MFQKVLVANRGEIAVRIIRALRQMGIKSVAVYSEADRDCLHTLLADEAICIGKANSVDSYLNMERILSATIISGADAIHPGFGFLSENARFAKYCEECNINFIGPESKVIEMLGDKVRARTTMAEAGVPVISGSKKGIKSLDEAILEADNVGYPVMIKAALGGGGKGMRVSKNKDELKDNFIIAQREAMQSFLDDTMYIERYIENPKHIEFQILADKYGNVIHLGERDCSIQRRHQKIIEEAPSVALDSELRQKMGEMAVRAAKVTGYTNAGTVEFLVDKNKNFYFMEMNTRIQVEHPVTEFITGIDIVKEQIKIAAMERLDYKQEDIEFRGHAIEYRINAENPDKKFMPSPARIVDLHLPGGNGIRIDTHIYNNYQIPPYYDSMMVKMIVYGKDRQEAIERATSALGEIVIEGPDTNIDFIYEIISSNPYLSGDIDTHFIDKYFKKYLE